MNSRQLTVQKAVENISKTIYFSKRWSSISSITTALRERYKLADIELSKATIQRHMGKLDPEIALLSFKHPSGVYRGRNNKESYYFFQKPSLDPPFFPSPLDKETWDTIKAPNNKQVG